MVDHQAGRARSGDLSIHFRKLGQRGQTPVLIVHGLQYFSWDWLPVAQALGAAREVVCMDMRGFGDSDWSQAKDYSVPSMAQDIVAVLDHLGWQRAILSRIEGHWARGCDAVLQVSEPYAAMMERDLGVRDVAVVRNCPDRWDPPDPRPDRFRETLGIPATTTIVLYQGLLIADRGIRGLRQVYRAGHQLVGTGRREILGNSRTFRDVADRQTRTRQCRQGATQTGGFVEFGEQHGCWLECREALHGLLQHA